MDVMTLGAALSIMKKMPDTAASSAATAKDAADRAEEAARTLTIDDTLSESGQAADSKAVGDALAEKLNIADLPDTNTVSNANQLLSEKYVVDTEPYHFRPSGGNGADREFDTIVGGSVVWNQLVDDSDSSVTVTSGHKYISKISGSYSVAVSDGTAVAVTGGTDEVFDITQMLGSTIADYIYSLEQATAGAGVAWFRKYFPNDYYDYNPGELMHVSDLQSHDTVGFNLFDADTVLEAIGFTRQSDDSFYVAGAFSVANKTVWKNKANYSGQICVSYSYKYNSVQDQGVRFLLYYTDGTKTDNYAAGSTSYSDKTIISSANKTIDRIALSYGTGSVATWLKDICINLSWSGTRDGEYEPYVKHSYPLDSSLTLRGIPKLTSDGDLIYDGDIYKPDGTVERRYGTRTYESGDESLSNAITDGTNTVYKLTTPTTEQAQSFQSPQILDPYGTEEYVTTSLVPVGHETKYPENLRAKIEGLPWNFANLIAPVEAEFKATRNYTSGSLFIVDNVLYKATANIANGGTITPNTNCTATTLAEIIAAL